jgi:hypothetical protein
MALKMTIHKTANIEADMACSIRGKSVLKLNMP